MGVRVTFNQAGLRALRLSPAVKKVLEDEANAIADRANAVPSTTEPAAEDPYYEVEDASTDRARFRVRTTGARASRHEAKTQALLRGFGGG